MKTINGSPVYFRVYRVNDRGPRVKHATLAEAAAEAKRLAGQHPGESFEILACYGIARCSDPSVFWNDGIDPSDP